MIKQKYVSRNAVRELKRIARTNNEAFLAGCDGDQKAPNGMTVKEAHRFAEGIIFALRLLGIITKDEGQELNGTYTVEPGNDEYFNFACILATWAKMQDASVASTVSEAAPAMFNSLKARQAVEEFSEAYRSWQHEFYRTFLKNATRFPNGLTDRYGEAVASASKAIFEAAGIEMEVL